MRTAAFSLSRNLLALLAGLAVAAPVLDAAAAVPATTMVEGVLSSAGGGPAADGSYPVVFSLYKDEVGGTAVWTEGPVTIALKNGQFTHMLGSKTPLAQSVLTNLGAQGYLGVKVDADPELSRKALQSVTFAMRAAVAEGVMCSGCIGAGHIDATVLAPYAKTASLSKVATSGAYADLTGGPDLTPYAKTASLSKVATSGAYADLTGGPDLTPYAKTASLAKVATTGAYADLTGAPTLAKIATTGAWADVQNPPVLAKVNASCGTGLVVKGIKADGSHECVASMDPAGIPPDGINEISNDLIWNQFTDSTAGKPNNPILDNNPGGTTDELTFPDIGTAQKLTVSVDLTNSKINFLKVSLSDPAGATYVLHDKTGTGTVLKTSWPDPTKTVSGDLTTWVGKNPKGKWKLMVVDNDYKNNTNDGQVNAWSINLQTISNKKIQIKGDLIVDGKITGAGVGLGSGGVVYTRACSWAWQSNGTWQQSQSQCSPPACASGHTDLGVSQLTRSSATDYDPWCCWHASSVGTSERTCLIPPGTGGTVYKLSCQWVNSCNNCDNAASLVTSCTPPVCGSGHTDLGTQNIANSVHSQTTYPHAHDAGSAAGWTERVCFIAAK